MTAMEQYIEPADSDENESEIYSDAYVSVGDSVGIYFKDIAKTPLLSAEQEVELSKRIEVGTYAEQILNGSFESLAGASLEEIEWLMQDGKQAFEHMVSANLRLAVSVANKYGHRDTASFEQSDRIQEANIGLQHAVKKFDYKTGNKFSTYATWWIRQAVTRGMQDQSNTIRYPVHVAEVINKMSAIERRLEAQLERKPLNQELADAMNISLITLQDIKDKIRPMSSLNRQLNADNGSVTEFGDLMVDDSPPVDDQVLAGLQREAVAAFVDSVLDRRSAEIIRLRYGIGTDLPLNLEQIGQRFGLTRERIRQLEAKAMLTLRKEVTIDQF